MSAARWCPRFAVVALLAAAGCQSTARAPEADSPAPAATPTSTATAAPAAAPTAATAPVPPTAPAAPAVSAPATPAPPAPKVGAYPGFRAPAFVAKVRRTTAEGTKEEPFDSQATRGATLYVINSATCPYCAMYVDRMKSIEKSYMGKGIDVVHVYPNRAEPPQDRIAWHAKQGFRGGQIVESDAAIARALEADRTPTAYLVDAAGVIVYRGAIDSNAFAKEKDATKPYLADAIDALVAGKKIETSTTEPEG